MNFVTAVRIPIVITLGMWAVFALQSIGLPFFGIIPREISGLIGIITSPMLHGSVVHIISNTVPFVVLAMLLFASDAKPIRALAFIWLVGGTLTWLLSRPDTNHIGMSGVVFGLLTYLIANAFRKQSVKWVITSLIAFFMFGGMLFQLLSIKAGVSFEGHLFGAISGVLLVWVRHKVDSL